MESSLNFKNNFNNLHSLKIQSQKCFRHDLIQRFAKSYVPYQYFLVIALATLSSRFSYSLLSDDSTERSYTSTLLHLCNKSSTEEKIIFPVALTREKLLPQNLLQANRFFLPISQNWITCPFPNHVMTKNLVTSTCETAEDRRWIIL